MLYKSDSDFDSDTSVVNRTIPQGLPKFNDRSEEDTKFRSFSFPNVQESSDNTSGSITSSPLKNKTCSMGSPTMAGTEKDMYMEESHGEALFNHLTNYCFSSKINHKDSSQTSPVASIFKRKNRAFSSCMSARKAVLKSETSRHSFSSQGSDVLSPTACDKTRHSQILAVSSNEEAIYEFKRDSLHTPTHLQLNEPNFISPSEDILGLSLRDSSKEYVYRSPKETIRDTFEQIERNSRGSFKSLIDFAERNNLDTRGKIFANCVETGDIAEPQIDLSIDRPNEHNDDDDSFESRQEEKLGEPWDELSFITYPHRLFG